MGEHRRERCSYPLVNAVAGRYVEEPPRDGLKRRQDCVVVPCLRRRAAGDPMRGEMRDLAMCTLFRFP